MVFSKSICVWISLIQRQWRLKVKYKTSSSLRAFLHVFHIIWCIFIIIDINPLTKLLLKSVLRYITVNMFLTTIYSLWGFNRDIWKLLTEFFMSSVIASSTKPVMLLDKISTCKPTIVTLHDVTLTVTAPRETPVEKTIYGQV